MHKILIANRGEIACRIIRSARGLGLETVAVYSEADRNALHVELADEAVAIGASKPAESYLRIDKLLAAARQRGADAVHPGYGFLAESADFARRALAEDLTWIGPTPAQIEAMGDKARARGLAAMAGVPIVPGSVRFPPGRLEGIAVAAEGVGYPLLVKAAAGGGGIGMQRVQHADELLNVAAATQAMAARAFGDGAVFLERFLPRARHVEIQVFGFGDGRAIHLFERDCSIQRRFQKIVEESPAPGLPDEIRHRMAAAAVALAASQRYAGAGTVEFIVDAVSCDFFFLEMNTRIQVEHPVTEMVTGLDLVALQIRLARGDDLSAFAQEAIHSRGHAIECRLYAENPAKMFLPSPGTLTTLRLPEARKHVRVDTGVRHGDAVTPFYDPLIAKLVCWGETRLEALEQALLALRSTRIEGIWTNVDFLRRLLAHGAFRSGDVHTGFIDAHKGELIA